MNVLTISSSDNAVSGASRVALDLHRFFVASNSGSRMLVGKKHGDDPTVVGISRPRYTKALSYLFSNDIDFFRTDYLLRTPEFLNADLVHCHNLNGWYFNLETMIKMSMIKPLVWTLHDMWALTPHCGHTSSDELRHGLLKCSDPDLYPSTLWNNDAYLARRKSALYAKGRFHVVTPSNILHEVVARTCLQDKMLAVVPNGIDTNLFKPGDAKAIKQSLKLDDDPVILFIGAAATSNVYKGFSDFAWLSEQWQGPKVQFLAVGAEKDELLGKVRLVRATSNRHEVASFLACADVLLLPSRFEVFPLVVLEALASGIPVVAYDVGGVREAITGLPACHIVPQGQKGELLTALRSSLGEILLHKNSMVKALRVAAEQNYSIGMMCDSYSRVYHQLLKTG
jgi:glycosyltransferase involved in cell wall biosynthesis